MKIRVKNSNFQSCLYCNVGSSLYRIEFDNGDIAYTCEKHRQEKDEVKTLIKEAIVEPEFFAETLSLYKKIVKALTG